MILELILTPVFALIGVIINLIPDMSQREALTGFDMTGLIDVLAYGFYVFPFELFMIFIGNVLFWLGAQMVWAIIEWAYKKIPGVN